MMPYINANTKVCSVDRDTDFFEIVARILIGDIFVPYLFIIWPVFVLRMLIDLIKENSFTLKKARGKRYATETITHANYTDDRALLSNTPILAKTLQRSLEQEARGIAFKVNADKAEF